MEHLLLARHGHALSNVRNVVSSTPPGHGLSEQGVEEALALRDAVAEERIDLAVASELVRTQETLAHALAGRAVPLLVLAGWNEIGFGAFEGGPLEDYREWAWTQPADALCPGDGETRAAVAERVAASLELFLERPEHTILAVGHALPVRYVLDAAAGAVPRARIAPVAHGVVHRLSAPDVREAAVLLRRFGATPVFAPPQA